MSKNLATAFEITDFRVGLCPALYPAFHYLGAPWVIIVASSCHIINCFCTYDVVHDMARVRNIYNKSLGIWLWGGIDESKKLTISGGCTQGLWLELPVFWPLSCECFDHWAASYNHLTVLCTHWMFSLAPCSHSVCAVKARLELHWKFFTITRSHAEFVFFFSFGHHRLCIHIICLSFRQAPQGPSNESRMYMPCWTAYGAAWLKPSSQNHLKAIGGRKVCTHLMQGVWKRTPQSAIY